MKKLIVANWKMNPQSVKEAEVIFNGILSASKTAKNADVVVCSPFVFLSSLKKKKTKKVCLGAQNVSSEPEGAYTGEVSALMLKNSGVSHIIIGHSERRAGGATNESINKKILITLKNKLIPVLCVGESSRDQNGSYLTFIKHQLEECLATVPKAQMKNVVIAYEPIWAIGKDATREATPEEFIEIRIFIRKVISDIYNAKTAHAIAILYGGSVHPENAETFLGHGGADGLLVGRDSLNPKKFGAIINALK